MFEKPLHQNVTNLPILAAIGGSMLMAASASATYIIADNFNDRDGLGISGTSVTTSISTPAEIWGASNVSHPRLNIGRLTVGNVSNVQTAYVDIPDFTAPESDPIVRVSAEINVGLANWIQVSLGNQGGTNPLTQTQLGFRVTRTGWTVRASNSDTVLGSGSGTYNNALYLFQLAYNTIGNTVSLSIDGTEVLTNVSAGESFTPVYDGTAMIRFTPVTGVNFSSTPLVDNFAIETVPVPEPSTLGLAVLGLATMFVRRQRVTL